MAYQGGPIPTLAISPSYDFNYSSTLLYGSNGNQVYQGSGQSFQGEPGQYLTGDLGQSAINIALNPNLGADITNQSGVSLSSGSNVLASTMTSLLSSGLSFGANRDIGKTLASAGQFGPILSQLGGLFGGGGAGGSTNPSATQGDPWGQKAFPGAGDEPKADYAGGGPYTLGTNGSDVVFSLQPANKGPQSSGLDKSINDPASSTTVPKGDLTNPDVSSPNAPADAAKSATMNPNSGGAALRDVPLWEDGSAPLRTEPLWDSGPSVNTSDRLNLWSPPR
jgi:hypothetical protein